MGHRLTRSKEDRILTGVAASLARHLEVDPLLVRAAFVALTLVWGIGVIAYLVAAAVIPEETEELMEQVPPGGSDTSATPISSASSAVTPAPSETEAKTPEFSAAPAAADTGHRPGASREDTGARRRNTVAIILIVIGVVFLLENYFEFVAWDRLWPVLLIAVGLLLLFRKRR